MGCEHANTLLLTGRCPCENTCFCKEYGVCRGTQLDHDHELEVRRRTTDKMPPLPKPHARLEIDLDDPDMVVMFLRAAADAIEKRRRVVLIIE